MGVMESRAGRAGRDAECFGDLRRGVARVVVQYEDGPLFGRKSTEPPFELVSIGDPEKVVGCRRSVNRQDPQIRHTTTLTRRLSDALVDQQTV
jgi:hypothetical protein